MQTANAMHWLFFVLFLECKPYDLYFSIFSLEEERKTGAQCLFSPFFLDTLPRILAKSGCKNQASVPELNFSIFLILRNPDGSEHSRAI